MIENASTECNHLTLITSESCNLSCSYCLMANQINKQKHKNQAIKVRESFSNGTYQKTIEQLVSRLNIDVNTLTMIELWGQEPTLTLDEFTQFTPYLYNKFPKLTKIFFSTNGIAFPERIVNYIKFISDMIDRQFILDIQFSYDGKENTLKQRGIDPKVILNNIEKVITELNKIKLSDHLIVNIFFHNVVDRNIIAKFSDRDHDTELIEYLTEFLDLEDRFIQLNTNPRIAIGHFSPATEAPFNASVKEGRDLLNFYLNCERVGKDFPIKRWQGICELHQKSAQNFPYDPDGKRFIQHAITRNFEGYELLKLSRMTTCGPNHHSIKIRYDGTLIHCQTAIIGLEEEEIKDNIGLDWDIQKVKIKKNFYPNIFTSSDEELSKYFYILRMSVEQSYPLLFSETLNLMILLLNAGQIDPSYKDYKKLLKHAYLVSMTNGCPYNNMMESGSIINRSTGWIRFLCNGFMDEIEKEYERRRKEYLENGTEIRR